MTTSYLTQRTKSRLAAAVAAIAIGLLLAAAPPAGAAYDPLASGTTKLTLDRGFLALLRQEGVKLSAVAPARLQGPTVTFPVSGGKFDPAAAAGTVEHEGALLLRAGNRSVPIRSPQLKTTQRRSPLSAKVGGSQLKLATAAGLRVSRRGFGERVEASGLALGAKLATRLAKKLRLPGVFKAGQPLGSSTTRANPRTIAVLAKGRASLALAPGILAKLGSLFVAVNPIFPAEHPGAELTLPIFGGQVAPDGSAGVLETSGSLEFLQLGAGQIFWREPWLELDTPAFSAEADVQPSPPYPGKQGRLPLAGLDLATAAVAADPKARTVSLSGAQLTLGDQSAAAFNQAFAQGKPAFAPGEPLGSFSFIAQGQ